MGPFGKTSIVRELGSVSSLSVNRDACSMHLQVEEVWYFVLKFVDCELEALVVSIESAKYIVHIFGNGKTSWGFWR